LSWYLGALRKYAVFSGRARRSGLLIFAAFDIQPGDDQYGPNPKGIAPRVA
jgi:uncharacterized membrane protein YhaH (DUF805 family)